MDAKQLSRYYKSPCKFRLRSGKEVYGVIWEGMDTQHYFATSSEYDKYSRALQNNDLASCQRQEVNIDDIIAAEFMERLTPEQGSSRILSLKKSGVVS